MGSAPDTTLGPRVFETDYFSNTYKQRATLENYNPSIDIHLFRLSVTGEEKNHQNKNI
jgi:hypothetical protein